jgi:hypothetical protein
METLEEYLLLITPEMIEEVRVGADVEPTSIIDGESVMKAAIHCCINGPVGIGKITTFPGVDGDIRIRDLFSQRITNKAWRKLCYTVSEHLERSLELNQKLSTQSYRLHSAFWPVYDDDQ